ncbi:MAG TPA: hypothetical protein VL614_15165 [Acetobacteraceae bacterium]|jgi:hypothetical protein|nr:hypothetical protein [Acetobacteraceae bacterium]
MSDQRSNRYTFRWDSSGLGEAYYTVFGAGELSTLRVRYEATEYQRSISSYSDADWERDVVGAIGLLTASAQPVPQDVVDAFNAWRLAEYNRHRAQIDAQPERYGVVDWDNDPVFKRPVPCRGAHYLVRWNRPDAPDKWKYGCVGLGWQVNADPELVEA